MGEVRIRTVTVTRPLKVISFTCCCLTLLLLTAATSTSDWMVAEGWREGLFMQCIEVGAPTPLPFDMADTPGCSKARSAGEARVSRQPGLHTQHPGCGAPWIQPSGNTRLGMPGMAAGITACPVRYSRHHGMPG